ncbi:hypothetical protein D3C72_1933900 [compost metagenome]
MRASPGVPFMMAGLTSICPAPIVVCDGSRRLTKNGMFKFEPSTVVPSRCKALTSWTRVLASVSRRCRIPLGVSGNAGTADRKRSRPITPSRSSTRAPTCPPSLS